MLRRSGPRGTRGCRGSGSGSVIQTPPRSVLKQKVLRKHLKWRALSQKERAMATQAAKKARTHPTLDLQPANHFELLRSCTGAARTSPERSRIDWDPEPLPPQEVSP